MSHKLQISYNISEFSSGRLPSPDSQARAVTQSRFAASALAGQRKKVKGSRRRTPSCHLSLVVDQWSFGISPLALSRSSPVSCLSSLVSNLRSLLFSPRSPVSSLSENPTPPRAGSFKDSRLLQEWGDSLFLRCIFGFWSDPRRS